MANGLNLNEMFSNPLLNRNVKSIAPDGTISLFDDLELLRGAVAGTGVPNAGGQGLGGDTPIIGSPNMGSNQSAFSPNPGLAVLLGQLGQAMSLPGSPAHNIGGIGAQMGQSQLFNQMLQQALRGNPNAPGASLSPLEVSGLSPEMQLAAGDYAERVEQNQIQNLIAARSLQTSDINDAYTTARTLALLSPEPAVGDFKVIQQGRDNEGRRLPAGEAWEWRVNMQTGEAFPIGPSPIDVDKSGGSGEPPSQKPATVNLFRNTLITQFGSAILEGLRRTQLDIDPKSGGKIVSVAQLLALIRDPLSGFDLETAETALAAVPEAFSNYNNRLEQALIQMDQGRNSGTILKELRSQRFELGKSDLPGFDNAKRTDR